MAEEQNRNTETRQRLQRSLDNYRHLQNTITRATPEGRALHTLLDTHQPSNSTIADHTLFLYCTGCHERAWPCKNINVITNELLGEARNE